MAEHLSHTTEDFAAVLRARRSIDLFEPEPVGSAVLLEAIEVARWAPNHRLTEPWRFYVIGPATRGAIIELAAELDTAAKGERAGAARRERLKGIPAFFVLDEPAQRRRVARSRGLRGLLLCCAESNVVSLAARRRRQMDERRLDAASTLLRPSRGRCEQGSRGRFFLVRYSENRAEPGAQERCRDSDGTTIATKGACSSDD